jgi:hypothetical protein
MNDNKLIFSLVIGIIVLFGLFMLLTGGDDEPVPAPVAQTPVQLPPPVPVTPAPVPEPVEEQVEIVVEPEPVEEVVEVEPVPEQPVLPALNDSDNFVLTELSQMDGGMPVLSFLVTDEIVRKFVIMVENISRGEFPDRNLPVQGPQEPMRVTELGSEFYLMDAVSYRRFNTLVNALTSIDTATVVTFYQRLLPLFRNAYAELGIPNSDFRDVTIAAIDNVLNARQAPQPQQLVRPSLNYLYADPQIENYSDVEKLLMRLGPGNTQTLQSRLAQIKRGLETGAR